MTVDGIGEANGDASKDDRMEPISVDDGQPMNSPDDEIHPDDLAAYKRLLAGRRGLLVRLFQKYPKHEEHGVIVDSVVVMISGDVHVKCQCGLQMRLYQRSGRRD